MKKIIGYGILVIVVISIISAIFTSDELKIEGIEITKVSNSPTFIDDENFQINESNGAYLIDLSEFTEIYITAEITGENFYNGSEENMNELELVFSDSKTAVVNPEPSDMFKQPNEGNYAGFAVKLLNKGETSVYIQTKDGQIKSETIKIVVADLNSLNGSSLVDTVSEINSIGFTAKYTDSFGNDMTETIKKYTEKDMKDWAVIKVDKINTTEKTVEIQLDTNEAIAATNEQKRKTEALNAKLTSASAWSAMREYGKNSFPYGFKLHNISSKLAERPDDENTWFLKAKCTITNQYNAKYSTVCEAKVTGTTDNPKVTYFYVYE